MNYKPIENNLKDVIVFLILCKLSIIIQTLEMYQIRKLRTYEKHKSQNQLTDKITYQYVLHIH